jgi:hypothetical protein
LKELFRNYIKVGIYEKACKELGDKGDKSELMEILALNNDIIDVNSPEKFWFYHNGITIFSYDSEKVCRRNNRIKLNPNKISIINGAQTLTNFYNAVNEIKYEPYYIKVFNNNPLLGINWLEESLDIICKEIKIKTIIIDGSDNFVKKISEGLNTQIPIEEQDILAISEEVSEINHLLITNRISITRDGEVTSDINLSVMEYIKKYLMIINEPGRSKNLNRNELEKLLKESIAKFKEDNFSNKLRILIDLDNWWKDFRKKNSFSKEDNQDIFYKYGKNYFGSYILSQNNMLIDEENLFNLFN